MKISRKLRNLKVATTSPNVKFGTVGENRSIQLLLFLKDNLKGSAPYVTSPNVTDKAELCPFSRDLKDSKTLLLLKWSYVPTNYLHINKEIFQ